MDELSQLPKISQYGPYSSNYDVHALCVDLGKIILYYSYKTIVAFWTAEDGLVISENVWSVTTGKHLNAINRDKRIRISYETFCTMLRNTLAEHIR